ncbi:hypothetical protein ERO13_D05G203750v2 [Gossypium hirsutum]|uniref:Uncharacterized protein n=1 Tax=Gossypium tomentosum TaxID=34277 RepID=A0A5D2KYV1_GOSTO|nr:hypothetical protein ERO13_D05G203750v2 [Gossypium hirsutum]TYH71969.1 hypothetical protein ES332_D05G221100v1 [Gossypium tomentosum]
MAQNNLILAAALVLWLLFSYGFAISEGIKISKAENLADGHKRSFNRDILEDAPADNVNAAYGTNDVHPTPRGHSPGAGHSTGHAGDDNN